MGGRGYPPEFRRRALGRRTAGRKVADLARHLRWNGLLLCSAMTPSSSKRWSLHRSQGGSHA